MGALVLRAVISGILVAIIAIVARRSPGLGGLIASIPLVSTLGMIWLWNDTGDREVVANYVSAAFWYFLPTLPMFLLIPWMLRSGVSFWLSLSAGCGLTIILYLGMIALLPRIGINVSL
ncbi:hypothetical protein C7451_10639 [Blastomonas natatoria]|uniref:DUF3147 family protein n=1 Tax=Blastomonas natatoria TaxID=34015 RepID=A0A2V3V512_9SPHN|nr:DUF3147 family protein [Blastomonas natatoria]PXW75878.1 hypothetical protein C7451_10639 [Blastomonas natatoria]